MWKKIIYYSVTAIFGVLFLLAAYYTTSMNRYVSIVEKAKKNDDYRNVIRLTSDFGNTQVIYSSTLSDGAVIKIFETSSARKITVSGTEYTLLDINYAIYISGSKLNTSNSHDILGDAYNKYGFELIAEDGSTFQYFIDNDLNPEMKTLVPDYTKLSYDYEDMSLFQIEIPYDFVNSVLSSPVTQVNIKNSDDTNYAEIQVEFDYDSDFFTQVSGLKDAYNAKTLGTKTSEEYNEYRSNWETEYYTNSQYVSGYTQSQLFPFTFYLKLVCLMVGYTVIILVVGDILVGKKRIIRLFNGLKKNKVE